MSVTTCRFCGLTDEKLVHAGTHECVCSKDCEIRMLDKQVEELTARAEKAEAALELVERAHLEVSVRFLDARDAALEDAARVVEEYFGRDGVKRSEPITTLIRALKTKGTP